MAKCVNTQSVYFCRVRTSNIELMEHKSDNGFLVSGPNAKTMLPVNKYNSSLTV